MGPAAAPLLKQRFVPIKHLRVAGAVIAGTSASAAESTKVIPLMSRDLTGIAGKEGAVMTVEYAPGALDPIHRHNAHVFVYVLEGSVIMQVKGAAPVTLRPGRTLYEGSDDIHLVGRNAYRTKPAKLLVVGLFTAFDDPDTHDPLPIRLFPVHPDNLINRSGDAKAAPGSNKAFGRDEHGRVLGFAGI